MELSPERIEAPLGEIVPVSSIPRIRQRLVVERARREALLRSRPSTRSAASRGGYLRAGADAGPPHVGVRDHRQLRPGAAYAAREWDATTDLFVAPDAPAGKVERMQELGARVEVHEHPDRPLRSMPPRMGIASSSSTDSIRDRRGAATIGVELTAAGGIDTAVVQLGDGALISGGHAAEVRGRRQGRGCGASGAPPWPSFAARRPISNAGRGHRGCAAITDPCRSPSRGSSNWSTKSSWWTTMRSMPMELIADSVGAGRAGRGRRCRRGVRTPTSCPASAAVLLTGAAA